MQQLVEQYRIPDRGGSLMSENFTDPKTMAWLLTQEGFLKWAEGNPLTQKDFKPQWKYLFKDFCRSLLTQAQE
jgi:hypothetical protein